MKSSILTFSVLAIMVMMTMTAVSFGDQTVLARGGHGSTTVIIHHGGHGGHGGWNHGGHHGGGGGHWHHGGTHGHWHNHHGGNGGGGYWVNNGGDNGYWVNNGGDNGGNGGIFVPNNSGYDNNNPAFSAGVQAGIAACQNSN